MISLGDVCSSAATKQHMARASVAALRDAEEGPSAATASRSGRTSDSDLPTASQA